MPLTQLQARLRAYFPEALIYDGSHISPAMGAKGAYLLILELGDPAHFQRARVAGSLPSGSYVYAGSARGAGGIAARLGRHFRRDKTVHWHIDELTVMADLAALALPGGSECGIVARLLDSGLFRPAFPGFGSSDCKQCEAHLLTLCSSGDDPRLMSLHEAC